MTGMLGGEALANHSEDMLLGNAVVCVNGY